jgi:hypothetical protein
MGRRPDQMADIRWFQATVVFLRRPILRIREDLNHIVK